MSTKLILGVAAVILIILAIVGFFFKDQIPGLSGGSAAPVATTTPDTTPAWATYATSTYSVDYPPGYTVEESYQYTGFTKKPIAGVAFVVPATLATGTNLSADTRVSVEQLPRANNCTGDIFINANVKATTLSEGGLTYSVATTTGAGAGNLYEEAVYAIAGSKPCTAVRYYIHSTNPANYEPGVIREFDRQALLTEFDEIRKSLNIGGTVEPATTAPVTP